MKVVFCGGCNPHVDREAVAAELEADERLRERDVVVYLSGCQRSCRSGRRLVLETPGAIVVAGEHVDGTPVPAREIVAHIRQRLEVTEGA